MNQKLKNILISTVWIIALSLFAYPVLLEAVLNKTKDFCDVYYQNQSSIISIFSNVGFFALALFDFFLGNRRNGRACLILGIFSVIFIGLIALISNLTVNNEIQQYYGISVKNLCFYLHGAFLLCLTGIKFLTLSNSLTIITLNIKGVTRR